jgi:esterase/lipase
MDTYLKENITKEFYYQNNSADSFIACIHKYESKIINDNDIAVIIIHGATSSGPSMMNLLNEIYINKYYTIAPDLPGHGLSGGILYDVTIENIIYTLDKCIDLIVSKQINKIVCICESLGSLVWINYMKQSNSLINKLLKSGVLKIDNIKNIILSFPIYLQNKIPFQNTIINIVGSIPLINDIKSPLLTTKIDNYCDANLINKINKINIDFGIDEIGYNPTIRLYKHINFYRDSVLGEKNIFYENMKYIFMFGEYDQTNDLNKCIEFINNSSLNKSTYKIIRYNSGHNLLISRDENEIKKVLNDINNLLI